MTANELEVVGPLPTFYVEELVEVQMQDVEVEGSPQCPVSTCEASMALALFVFAISPSHGDSSNSLIPHLIVYIRSPFSHPFCVLLCNDCCTEF